MRVVILVSFDIDGTLEVGEPPGPISLRLVQEAKDRGYIVGSASDRTLSYQRQTWEKAGIEVDFVSHKHHLDTTKTQFSYSRLIHIGDTTVDEYYAGLAGFEFWFANAIPERGTQGWIF